jgi:hypothetical protein
MKRTIVSLLLSVLVSTATVWAQNPKSSAEKMNKEDHLTKRISYLNSNLGLSAADSAKFWPVYIQMTDELKANRKNYKSEKGDQKISELSDAEVKKIIDNGFAMRQKDLDIRKSYNDKFIALIGVKKVAELYMLDHPKGNYQHNGPKGEKPHPKK